jgi:hypothetical protein
MKQKNRTKGKTFYENLTRLNTILLSILLVFVGLDFLKKILVDDPDLMYPLFYTFLGFALITYTQHVFFSYFDNHISPILARLREDLEHCNNQISSSTEENMNAHQLSNES